MQIKMCFHNTKKRIFSWSHLVLMSLPPPCGPDFMVPEGTMKVFKGRKSTNIPTQL